MANVVAKVPVSDSVKTKGKITRTDANYLAKLMMEFYKNSKTDEDIAKILPQLYVNMYIAGGQQDNRLVMYHVAWQVTWDETYRGGSNTYLFSFANILNGCAKSKGGKLTQQGLEDFLYNSNFRVMVLNTWRALDEYAKAMS